MATSDQTSREAIQAAVEHLNDVLEAAYKEGYSVRIGLMPTVQKGVRRDDQNLVTIS